MLEQPLDSPKMQIKTPRSPDVTGTLVAALKAMFIAAQTNVNTSGLWDTQVAASGHTQTKRAKIMLDQIVRLSP